MDIQPAYHTQPRKTETGKKSDKPAGDRAGRDTTVITEHAERLAPKEKPKPVAKPKLKKKK